MYVVDDDSFIHRIYIRLLNGCGFFTKSFFEFASPRDRYIHMFISTFDIHVIIIIIDALGCWFAILNCSQCLPVRRTVRAWGEGERVCVAKCMRRSVTSLSDASA